MLRVINLVGARPNFMKMAPIIEAMQKYPDRFQPLLVHTGQHYDERMSQSFFVDLGMPKPDLNLEVGSGSHAEQTARVMVEFEKVCLSRMPDLVIVVGDVNSAIGTNVVVGNRPDRILHHAMAILKGDAAPGKVPEKWDGKAAERIVQVPACLQ